MSKLLVFIGGTIEFTAQGGFSERFLNLCHVKGVKLYHLTEKDGVLYAATSLNSFRKIRRCATRSGMRVRITEKKGLPFLYARFAGRTGLFIGIAIACFLLFFYTRSVWSIEVKGNTKISDEAIISVLNENGVCEGVFKNQIDQKRLSYQLYEAIPEISWLNIGVDGSKLCVNVREVVQKPENKDAEGICNIVAASDGVIDKITVYEGESKVKEGYGVKKGQLLVSGVIYHETSKRNTFHPSRADIYAFTKRTHTVSVPKVHTKTVYTGEEKQYKVLRIFRLRMPLYIFRDRFAQKEVSLIKKEMKINGKILPFSIDCYAVKELTKKREKLTAKSAEALARAEKKKIENKLPAGTKILSVKKSVTEKKNAFVFTFRYELYENIAKTAPIEISGQKSE